MNLEWFLFEFVALLYIKASVILTAGIICSWALKNYQASTRYGLWSLVLLLILLLPLLQHVLPHWEAPVIHPPGYTELASPTKIAYASQPTTIESVITFAEISEHNSNLSLSFWEHVLGIGLFFWLAGSIVLLAKLLADLLGLAIFSRNALPAPAHWSPLLQEARRAVKCKPQVKVGINAMIGSPLIWGLLRPKILMPAAAVDWSEERLKTVFLHELTHASRMDHVMVLVNQLCKCMYWSNPLVWYVVHRHSLERELSCDEQVVQSGKNHIEYAEELVAITRDLKKERKYASVAMTQQQGLAERIRSIIQQEGSSLHVINVAALKFAATAALILMVVLSTAAMVAKPSNDSFQADVLTLFGRDAYLADEAAKALGNRGDQRAIPYLLKTAADYPVPHTRMQSILAIGKLGDQAVIQNLINLFQEDPSASIRYSLINVLERFDEDFALEALKRMHVNDADDGIKMRAYVGLVKHEIFTDPQPVFMHLNHPDEETRNCAVNHTEDLCRFDHVQEFMQQHDMASCQSLLVNAAGDQSPAIRQDALHALASLGLSENNQGLDNSLIKIKDHDTRQRAKLSLKAWRDMNDNP